MVAGENTCGCQEPASDGRLTEKIGVLITFISVSVLKVMESLEINKSGRKGREGR